MVHIDVRFGACVATTGLMHIDKVFFILIRVGIELFSLYLSMGFGGRDLYYIKSRYGTYKTLST